MSISYATAGFRMGLLSSVGQYLQEKGVAKWTTPWATTDTAITVDALPAGSTATPPSPDKAISMTLYPVSSPGGTDMVMGLQLRIRGEPKSRTVDKDLVDKAEDALHGVRNTSWGGIPIVYVEIKSGAYLGTDTANRPEHTLNFYITLTREGLNRTD